MLLDVMMPHDRRLGDAAAGAGALRRGAIPVVMFSGKVDEQAQARRHEAARRASSASRSTSQQLIEQTKQTRAASDHRR